MAGEIGNAVADELKGKLEIDEQSRLNTESDETYDSQVFAHLHDKLEPEIMAFNEQAQAADQLKLEKGSNTLQFFRENRPSFAVLVKGRSLHFLDAGSSAATESMRVLGGPDSYEFLSSTMGKLSEEDLLKGLVRLTAGAKFRAE